MKRIRRLVLAIAKENDQKAFREFFSYYYPKLLRFALYHVNSELLAEEVVSDVFMKVWNNRWRISEIENIDLYMFTSVRNQSITYLKKRSLESVPIDYQAQYNFLERSHPEHELLNKELIVKLEEIIHKLPPKCQMVFRLSRDEGFKYEEVAQILGISKSTVKNQMTTALKKIKEELSLYFDEGEHKKYNFLMSLFLTF